MQGGAQHRGRPGAVGREGDADSEVGRKRNWDRREFTNVLESHIAIGPANRMRTP